MTSPRPHAVPPLRRRMRGGRESGSDAGPAEVPDTRARWGALGVVAALLAFAVATAASLGVAGTAYVWNVNMLSDLGDSSCRVRGGRWICSPGFALFNAGLVAAGTLLVAGGGCLSSRWGRLLAGSVVVMGGGLLALGIHPADVAARLHLVGVVLALVVPALGLLASAIRPETPWLDRWRAWRGALGAGTLVLCAESGAGSVLLPRGTGELLIVGTLLLALLLEAARILAHRR